MNSDMLVAKELYKSYGAIRAVEGISLRVERGQSLCIQGRSGCGKTTLLKMLALISKPDRGDLLIDGTNASTSSEQDVSRLRVRIGFSFQEPLLLPYLNALQNLSLVISSVRARKLSELASEAKELLSQLGLSKRLEHLPSKLSVGEKKRVDLARALIKHPLILVADEPFSNLDPDTSDKVGRVFKDYLTDGGTLVFSSTEPTHSRFAKDTLKMLREGSDLTQPY